MDEVVFRGAGFELPLVTSAVIPPAFRHGFSTRRGGVSAAPFDSLNLGGKWGDSAAAVTENRRRLHAAAGGPIPFVHQVHGARAVRVAPGIAADEALAIDADAVIVAAGPGPDGGAGGGNAGDETKLGVAGVMVADCVPVLIADLRTNAVAAVHAGWRGTVAGVLPAALARMSAELGTRPGDVRVAIGPSIGPCCFEVGPEVVDAIAAHFDAAPAAAAVVRRQPRPHVDLWLLNRVAAEAAGVPPGAIDVAGMCTRCAPDRFFSYRRDRGVTGQMAAFISTPAAPATPGACA